MADETRSAIHLLRGLRAVRQFSDRSLPDEVASDIFEVVRWSGNASNRQQFEVLWVDSRETLTALSKLEGYAGHLAGAAAGAVIVTWMERDELNAFDEGRIAERIMLAAHAHGVGSCIGWLRNGGPSGAKRLLGIQPERTVRTTVSLGYPAQGAARGGRRKPIAELVRRFDP